MGQPLVVQNIVGASGTIGSGVVNPAVGEFRIGRQYGGNGEYWSGRIDDVRVWNTARTLESAP